MAKKPPDSKQPADEAQKKPPAYEVKAGRCRCTIWLNESAEGPWYSMVFRRTYKDAKDGSFKTATTFGRDDLLVVAELARLAWMWIASQTGGSVGDIAFPGGAPQSAGSDDDIPI